MHYEKMLPFLCSATHPNNTVHSLGIQEVDLNRITWDLAWIAEQTLPEYKSIFPGTDSLWRPLSAGTVCPWPCHLLLLPAQNDKDMYWNGLTIYHYMAIMYTSLPYSIYSETKLMCCCNKSSFPPAHMLLLLSKLYISNRLSMEGEGMIIGRKKSRSRTQCWSECDMRF